MGVAAPLLTVDEYLALPVTDQETMLFRGRVIVLDEENTTRRNRTHARVEARVAGQLLNWLELQPEPRGDVFSGEIGLVLDRNESMTVGAYVGPDVIAVQTDAVTMIEGVPVLAVEILSPNNTVETIKHTLGVYRAAGVPLVWMVDPYDRTVTVYEKGRNPYFLDDAARVTAGAHLPGFDLPVRKFFE